MLINIISVNYIRFGEHFLGLWNAHRIGDFLNGFKTILLSVKKIKTPDNHKIKGFLNRFGTILVEPEGPELTFQTLIKKGCSTILKIYAHRIGNYFQRKQVRFLK